jgi:diketogulonate reductase-like aldo/keto reductase
VSLEQLEEARSVVPIAAVENSFGPFRQQDRPVVDYCADQSIAYLSYSPLRPARSGPKKGLGWEEAFPGAAAVAAQKELSMQRLALAWLLQVSPALIPICGASRPETAVDSALAAQVSLSADELEQLDF